MDTLNKKQITLLYFMLNRDQVTRGKLSPIYHGIAKRDILEYNFAGRQIMDYRNLVIKPAFGNIANPFTGAKEAFQTLEAMVAEGYARIDKAPRGQRYLPTLKGIDALIEAEKIDMFPELAAYRALAESGEMQKPRRYGIGASVVFSTGQLEAIKTVLGAHVQEQGLVSGIMRDLNDLSAGNAR